MRPRPDLASLAGRIPPDWQWSAADRTRLSCQLPTLASHASEWQCESCAPQPRKPGTELPRTRRCRAIEPPRLRACPLRAHRPRALSLLISVRRLPLPLPRCVLSQRSAIQRSPSQLQRRPSRLLDQIERSRKLSGVPEGAAEPGAPAGRGGRGAAVALETAGARGKGRSRDKGAAGEAEPARAEAQAAVAEPSSNSPARTSSESDQPARSPTTVPPAYPPAPPPPASPPPSSSPPAPVPARSVPAPAATGRGPSAPARAAPQPAVLQRKHEHLPKPRPKSDFAALHSAPFEFVALARPDASPRQRQRQRLTVMGPVGVLGPSTDGLNQHSDRDPYSHERPLAAAKRVSLLVILSGAWTGAKAGGG